MGKWTAFVIAIVLFLGAVFFRYTSYLDARDVPGRETLAFQSWGYGRDQDYQLRCGIQYSQGKPDNEALSHYDYFFMCPYFSFVFDHLSFINSLEFFIFVNILIGGIVTVAPFLTLWFLDRHTIGGLIASMVIMLSPVMIHNADGRFFIYPLVTLFFTAYYIAFLFSLRTMDMTWLTAFGTIAVLHGINKPFMYVNDMSLMMIFPFFFMIKKVILSKDTPFIRIKFYPLGELYKALVPSIIYFVGIVSFEILHHQLTQKHFFLTDLFIDTGGSTKDAVLGASLEFKGSKYQQMVNIVSLIFLAAKEWLDLVLRGPLLFGLVLTGALLKKRSMKVIIGIITLTALTAVGIDQLISKFLYPNSYVRIDDWFFIGNSLLGFFGIAFAILSFHSLFLFGWLLFHAFYFGGLALSLQAVKQPQLFVTLVVWAALMIGLATDQLLVPMLKKMTKRTFYTTLFLSLLIFVTPFHQRFTESLSNIQRASQEKKYLSWVAQALPEDAKIIGGADDNLIWLSKYTNKTIIYSGFAVASPIGPDQLAKDLKYYPKYPVFIKKNIVDDQESNFFILDQNKQKWEQLLSTGVVETYPKDKYVLRVFAHNDELERSIYMLTLRSQNLLEE